MEDIGARLALDQHAKLINKLSKHAEDTLRRQQQKAQDENIKKVADLLAEVQGKLIDRSAAYTNLVMIGGYAGIFSIWAATRSNLSPKIGVAIALSLTISLTSLHWLRNLQNDRYRQERSKKPPDANVKPSSRSVFERTGSSKSA